MNNILTVDDVKASIEFNEETEMFRGEILGLTGYADFYGKTVPELKKAFKKSLKVYLDACKEDNAEPFKSYSGKFVTRIDSDTHEKIALAAASEGKPLNKWVKDILSNAANEYLDNRGH